MQAQPKSNKLTIKQIEELRAMFTCYSKDDMMTPEQLDTMFANIGFVPTESQQEKHAKLFAIRGKISCSEFMSIFKIKSDDIPYSKSDVLNAFKFLSQEYKKPNHINKERVRDVLKYLEMTNEDIAKIMHSLEGLADAEGDIDYRDLVESLF